MVPKENGFNQSETASAWCARRLWRFPCSPPMESDVEFIQRQHFCHHGDTICHRTSGCVTTNSTERLHVDATVMRYFQAELFSRFLPTSYASHIDLAAAEHWLFMPKCKHGSTVELIIFLCSRCPYCLSTVSNIMIILSSDAVGYNVIGVFRWIFPKC